METKNKTRILIKNDPDWEVFVDFKANIYMDNTPHSISEGKWVICKTNKQIFDFIVNLESAYKAELEM